MGGQGDQGGGASGPRVSVPCCPFCGAGSGFRRAVRVSSGDWAVQCLACNALGPPKPTPPEARRAWSARIVRREGAI